MSVISSVRDEEPSLLEICCAMAREPAGSSCPSMERRNESMAGALRSSEKVSVMDCPFAAEEEEISSGGVISGATVFELFSYVINFVIMPPFASPRLAKEFLWNYGSHHYF